MSTLVNQPTNAPTRKLATATLSAATIGQAIGGALCDVALHAATLSPWLTWLGNDYVLPVIMGIGLAVGTGLPGWMVRDRAP